MKSASHSSAIETRRLSLVNWRSVKDPLLQQTLFQARIAFPSDWSEEKLSKLLDNLHGLITSLNPPSNDDSLRLYELVELINDQLLLGHVGLTKLREQIGVELFCCALAFYAAATGERDAAIRFSEQAKTEALLPDAIRWRKDSKQKAKGRKEGTITTKGKGAETRNFILQTAAELRKQGRPEHSIAHIIQTRSNGLELTRNNEAISLRHIRRTLKGNRP